MTLKEDQLRELIDFLDSTKLEEDDKNYFIAQFHAHGKKTEILAELNEKLKEKGHQEIPLEESKESTDTSKAKVEEESSPKKEVTLETEGQSELDKKIKQLDDKYEERFQKLEKEAEEIEKKMDELQEEYDKEFNKLMESNSS